MKLQASKKLDIQMAKSSIHIFILFLSVLLLYSCKTRKSPTSLKTKSAKFLLKKLNNQQLDAEWYSSKAKITYRDQQQGIKFSASIRMRKDSVIWMNVKKLGVEAARIQITKDSIYIINRLDKNYIISDFKYIEDRYSLPANFETLQNLLLGNPVIITADNKTADTKELNYILKANNDQIKNEYWLDGATFLLTQMSFDEQEQKRNLSVQQSGYEEIANLGNFPKERDILVESRETGNISMSIALSKIEINTAKSIKFKIPDHYERFQ